ncbi:MAG: IS1595 family transposase [Proteobacteria bacterium]|nr:IS1595 family transposase [Pseudomonadota bacterium]
MQITQRFSTEEAARHYFERLRWPDGPVCPHCGNADRKRIYKVTPNPAKKIRAGLYKCAECRDQFTVTVGTVCEDSHIPLNKWLIAFYMMCASKTQISALQVQRHLELGSYRSAWFMCHRIRFALQDIEPTDKLGGTVEADETYIGGKRRGMGRRYVGNKTPIVSLVERGGRVRSQVVNKVTGAALDHLLRRHVSPSARLNTDESPAYKKPGKRFASHETVNHRLEEYVRRDKSGRLATTNTAEGFFGNSKRSLDGTHHHVSSGHIPLYIAELDYKYNTRKVSDGERTIGSIQRMTGKRLMLRRPKITGE